MALTRILLGAAVLTITALSVAAAPLLPALHAAIPGVAQVSTECARVATTRAGDSLVNTCGSCRDVKVRRSRAGEGFPAMRDYKVMPNSSVSLSFKGPGQTQIVGDQPCAGEEEVRADGAICVQMINPPGKPPVLANTCEACRAVKIETKATSGNTAKQLYTLKGKTYIPVPWLHQGAARIVADVPCA